MFNTYARAHASSILISFHILENARADTHVNIPFLSFCKFLSNVDESWFLYIYIYIFCLLLFTRIWQVGQKLYYYTADAFFFLLLLLFIVVHVAFLFLFFPSYFWHNLYLYTYIYIYTYIHVYIYICICVRLNRYSLIRYNTSI